MRPLAALPIVVLLFASASAESRLTEENATLLQEGLVTTAEAFVRPAYAAQSAAADALVGALDVHCAAPGAAPGAGPDAAPTDVPGDPSAIEARFAELFLAWQRSALIRIGPIMDDEGPMRVQLWPDPKGFSERAVRAALGAEDRALLATGALEGRSVALTNLTALETLIHAPLRRDGYPCALATAIAAFQADLARGLVEAWTTGSDFRRAFDAAATGNDRFADVDAVVRRLLAGAVVEADRLRKFKLLRGLGTAPGEARPTRTEAVDSGLGLASVEASFRALADFYATPFGLFDAAPEIGGSMDYVLLEQTARSVADDLAFESASLAEIAGEDGARAAELRRHAESVLHHEAFLKGGFPSSIGLTAGFTAADGD